MSDTRNAVLSCDCACHLRGHGCKEVVPLRAEVDRLREGIRYALEHGPSDPPVEPHPRNVLRALLGEEASDG